MKSANVMKASATTCSITIFCVRRLPVRASSYAGAYLTLCSLFLLTGSPASAGVVSTFWTIHNATGQPANDFHVFGNLGTHPGDHAPIQTDVKVVEPAGWSEVGITIGPANPPPPTIVNGEYVTLYPTTIDFAGPPIPHCQSLKIVKEWDVTGNLWLDLRGSWTTNGIPIAGQPNIPMVGFSVNDMTQGLLLQNATAAAIDISSFQLAVSSTLATMDERANPYSGTLGAMSWTTINGLTSIGAGQELNYNLVALGIVLEPGQYLYSRYGTWDAPLGQYVEQGWTHGSIPEPGALTLLLSSGLLVFSRRRRGQKE